MYFANDHALSLSISALLPLHVQNSRSLANIRSRVPQNFILLISGGGDADGSFVQVNNNDFATGAPAMLITQSSYSADIFQIDDNSFLATKDDSGAAWFTSNYADSGSYVWFSDPESALGATSEFATCSLGGVNGTSLTCSAYGDDTWFYCPSEQWIISAPAGGDTGSEFGPDCEPLTLSAVAPPKP